MFRTELLDLIARYAEGLEREQLVRYVDLVLSDENRFYTLDELRRWIDDIREKSSVTVTRKPVKRLDRWRTDSDTGEIVHDTGEFFSIIGAEISNSSREVAGWDQPFVYQREMGVLGLVMTRFDGVPHYLLNAKAEPGNTLLYQLSPTLQATYSNLKTAHGGRIPAFAQLFADGGHPHATVRYRQWLAEDGGRFFQKSNLNMIVEVEEQNLQSFDDNFRWFTLSQIKAMLREDNYINPHVRGILCHL